MRRRFSISLLILFRGLVSAQEGAERIQDVQKIYVDSFGTADGAEAIRSKLIVELGKVGLLDKTPGFEKAPRFEAVPSAGEADAILKGESKMSKPPRSAPATSGRFSMGHPVRFHASAGVKLIGRDQKILWMEDTSVGAASHFEATSDLAERIVKDLRKAVSAKN